MARPTFPADSSVVADVRPSTNQSERVNNQRPSMIVLHYTGMTSANAALDLLCSGGSQVSAHYFVFEDGRIVQMVPESRRAWHAGSAFWGGETDINSCSIGIEIANPGHEHRTLYDSGVGHWVRPGPLTENSVLVALGDSGETVSSVQEMLAEYGYGIAVSGIYDSATHAVVTAFQRHFRPERVDGVCDESTRATLQNLIATRGRVRTIASRGRNTENLPAS
jgi:N-acetylmuramoyl-L-alanine amidase